MLASTMTTIAPFQVMIAGEYPVSPFINIIIKVFGIVGFRVSPDGYFFVKSRGFFIVARKVFLYFLSGTPLTTTS